LIAFNKSKESKTPSENPLGPTGKESVYDSVLDHPVLPPSEKSLLRLEQEGALLALAGTESPAESLNTILYHLCANPRVLQNLRIEQSTISNLTSWTWTTLEQLLPYLSAVIEEGDRLSFGVTARTARIAHEPLTYTPSSPRRHLTLSPQRANPTSSPLALPSASPRSASTPTKSSSKTRRFHFRSRTLAP